MTNIKVVDSIMGSYKTTTAINMMNENKEEKYIYITPFLSEVERIKQMCRQRNFKSPENYSTKTKFSYKLDSMHELLVEGHNIAATHALFKTITLETRELIEAQGYTLVLDEVMDVVEPLKLTDHDREMLSDSNKIFVDENGFVVWNEENPDAQNYRGVFDDIKRYSLNQSLVMYADKILLWTFPFQVFKIFKECYILTYLFDGQIQKYYFDLHGVSYEKFQVAEKGFNNLKFIQKTNDEHEIKIRDEIKGRIEIYEGNLNLIGEKPFSLSKSWYKKSSRLHPVLKNNLYNYIRNVKNVKSDNVLWTTFSNYENKMGGKGFKKGFLSCNARATNEYQNRNVVCYTVNRFVNPIVVGYFKEKNVYVYQDLWAVSEMIQFIWRAAIRNEKEISLYIPSKRMRTIFLNWLNGEDLILNDEEVPENIE